MGAFQTKTRTRAAIAIGGNEGDLERTFKRALARLNGMPGITVLRRSNWIPSKPVGGPPGQPDFLNGAITVETTGSARELLDQLLAIETHFGRSRENGVPNGPRPLDLDLLLFGDQVIGEEGLTVPHPRMAERDFVLAPLAEIAGDWPIPRLGQTVTECLQALGEVPSP